MNNEIFKFAIIRSPKLASPQKLDEEIIKVVELTSEPLTFYEELKDLVSEGSSRSVISEAANSFLSGHEIDNTLSCFETRV